MNCVIRNVTFYLSNKEEKCFMEQKKTKHPREATNSLPPLDVYIYIKLIEFSLSMFSFPLHDFHYFRSLVFVSYHIVLLNKETLYFFFCEIHFLLIQKHYRHKKYRNVTLTSKKKC